MAKKQVTTVELDEAEQAFNGAQEFNGVENSDDFNNHDYSYSREPVDENRSLAEMSGGQASSISTMFSDTGPGVEDISFPVLRLAQGLTAEVQSGEAKPGQWIISGEVPLDEVVVIPLLFNKRRELRDPDTREQLCVSIDSMVGVGNPGGICAQCSMNKWTDDEKGGKRRPPACTFFYSYIVYVVESQSVALLEFKRTGINVGKSINTMIAMRGLRNFGIKLSSTGSKGPRGTYYVPSAVKSEVSHETLMEARSSM